MRVIATIPHPDFTISIFNMNDKYLIKIEAGAMEQTFKLPQDRVKGLDEIKKIVDETFLKETYERFKAMHDSFKLALGRNA